MFPLHIPSNTEIKGTVKCTHCSVMCNLINTNSSLLSCSFMEKPLGSYKDYHCWGTQILQKPRIQPKVLGA